MSGVEIRPVAPGEADLRLDRWVKRHYPALPHVALQKLLRTGQFRVDGRRVEAGTRLQPGQQVRVPPLADAVPARPAPLRREDADLIRSLVIHDDAEIVALAKPPGLAVQGGSKTTRHIDGMLDALARGGERPRLVHRLDRDTSGVLVLARSAAVARQLMHAFQQHEVRKLYWAILMGGPARNEMRVDLPVAKQGGPGRERMAVDPETGGRFARTELKVLARALKVATWAALLPLTGRTHQLRAHCAAIGAPILGDAKYGGAAAMPAQAPAGLMLHAREIEIPRPGRRPLRLQAPAPAHLAAGLAWLGLDVPPGPGSTLAEWPPEAEHFPFMWKHSRHERDSFGIRLA